MKMQLLLLGCFATLAICFPASGVSSGGLGPSDPINRSALQRITADAAGRRLYRDNSEVNITEDEKIVQYRRKHSKKGSKGSSKEDSNDISEEGSNERSKEGSKEGSKKDSNEGSKEGSNEGSKEGSSDGSKEGSKEGSNERSKEGSKGGSNEGGKEGSNEGSKEGSNDGSKEGSNEGSKEGSNEGGKEGSNEGHSEESGTTGFSNVTTDGTLVTDFPTSGGSVTVHDFGNFTEEDGQLSSYSTDGYTTTDEDHISEGDCGSTESGSDDSGTIESNSDESGNGDSNGWCVCGSDSSDDDNHGSGSGGYWPEKSGNDFLNLEIDLTVAKPY